MSDREFIAELAGNLNYTIKDTSELANSLLDNIFNALAEGNVVAITGFGTFEVQKRLERIVVNPVTQQRMLVPPQLVLTYKSSNHLKNKLK